MTFRSQIARNFWENCLNRFWMVAIETLLGLYTYISNVLMYIYIALQSMVVSPLHHHHLNYLPEIHWFLHVISIFFGSTDWSKKARCQLSRSLIFGCISAHAVTNFNGLQPFTTFLEHLKKTTLIHSEEIVLIAELPIWVCLKMLCTPKANGFADHYPY